MKHKTGRNVRFWMGVLFGLVVTIGVIWIAFNVIKIITQ